MAFPDLFKLEKLRIEAYGKDDRKDDSFLKKIEAMFNPTTLTQRYGVKYVPASDQNQKASFAQVLPATLTLQLLFDGTGVDQIGVLTLFSPTPTVREQIDTLLQVCYQVQSATHEPSFLKVIWGKNFQQLQGDGFRGRLASMTINYTSFDRDGSPLRAQCDLTIVGDDSLQRQISGNNPSSPDLTHARTVRAGDTLPLLTAAIYGSSRYVVAVARANDLDHLRPTPPLQSAEVAPPGDRDLAPGRDLIFPPIAD